MNSGTTYAHVQLLAWHVVLLGRRAYTTHKHQSPPCIDATDRGEIETPPATVVQFLGSTSTMVHAYACAHP
jgi:phage gp37-like protein